MSPPPVSLELRLQERLPERIFLTVCLQCVGAAVSIEGVTVEWLTQDREHRLAPRLLLPISGTLVGPLVTEVVLRSHTEVPRGSVLVGTAWWASDQVQCVCPADHGTELKNHMRGSAHQLNDPYRQLALRKLTEVDRARLTRHLPWVDTWKLPVQRNPDEEETEEIDTSMLLQEISGEFGLDEDTVEWLSQLFDEEDL